MPVIEPIERACTPRAAALVAELAVAYGPLAFHLASPGGAGATLMCYRASEFRVGSRDVRLGDLAGCPFYVDGLRFVGHGLHRIIVDAVEGSTRELSLEGLSGRRFIAHCVAAGPKPWRGGTRVGELSQNRNSCCKL